MPGNANKKLYNAGSEWQDDIDGLADYYSTFFREYDPVIGRFNGVDPVSESFESFLSIFSHLAEEIWSKLGGQKMVSEESFPEFDPKFLVEDEIKIAIQVNGKLRGVISVKKDFPKTHSIQKLLSLLSDDYQIDDIIRRATLLTDYAVDTRYPIEISEQPDENDYKEALALAESVYSWAQEKIGLL
jgi:leucyl-tRNA synthetase